MNVYDTVAHICSLVIRSCSEDFFVKYSCVSPQEKQRIHSLIFDKLPFLFEDNSSFRVCKLKEDDFTDVFDEKLDDLVRQFTHDRDYFSLVGLIQVLDEALENLLHKKINESQEDDFTVVLNSNRESTGIGLLPRTSCVWERRHRLSYSYNRMDNFLFNMLLMENSILGDLIDRHFFLKRGLFPDFSKTKSLKIAATPLLSTKKFKVIPYSEGQVQYFKIEYTQKTFDEDNELVWKKILSAASSHADIIVFPEMLGNPQLTRFVTEKIKSLPPDLKDSLPSLIILPSYWDKKRNTVTILDKSGDIICTQSKQNPFRAEQNGSGYLEGIISSQVVNIFHFEGIGRFAILICKDFLTTRYMEQLMRCFKLTLIIVPSFSTGSYDFRQSFDLCAHDDCNVVWINTCSAFEKGKESNFENIGYVRKRISRNDDEAQMLCKMSVCDGFFAGKCTKDCIYYETISAV